MLVSILITSYNYGAYVAAAIDSALNQTYTPIEVIVVDDGSTDTSRAIIASYGDRIAAYYQTNGGPNAALNTAFANSHGDLLCLLDADDMFESTKVQAMVDAASQSPRAYLFHHQMQMIDADGAALHPPFPRHIANGDLRRQVARAGGWFPHALTSGLTFRRSYLERLFPLPQSWSVTVGARPQTVPLGADTYLAGPAALLAPVVGVRRVLARYRAHDANRSTAFIENPELQLIRYTAEHEALTCVMRRMLEEPADVRLDQHLGYQLARCAAGEVSRIRTAGRVLGSEVLPLGVRCREALRVCANRGVSRRDGVQGSPG
jgi:hypothetical protein